MPSCRSCRKLVNDGPSKRVWKVDSAGEEMELNFPIMQQLPVGNYELICEVPTGTETVKAKQLIGVGQNPGKPVSSSN